MAYDVNKLVKLQGLKDLATQVKSELSALSTRIDDIVSTGGEPNVITSVKVNGPRWPSPRRPWTSSSPRARPMVPSP